MARRTVRDRAQSRLRFFGEKRRHDYRHRSPGAARLGGVRDRLLHSLFRLQRHLSFQRTGAPERQHRRRARRRRERRRQWPRSDHRDRARLRSAMPFLRRGQHPGARLGSSDLRRFLDRLGGGETNETRSRENSSCRQYRGGKLRGFPAGASRRAFALERRGFCQRGAAWGLRGAARARGNDRAGPDF